jgi:hypothetical protein
MVSQWQLEWGERLESWHIDVLLAPGAALDSVATGFQGLRVLHLVRGARGYVGMLNELHPYKCGVSRITTAKYRSKTCPSERETSEDEDFLLLCTGAGVAGAHRPGPNG